MDINHSGTNRKLSASCKTKQNKTKANLFFSPFFSCHPSLPYSPHTPSLGWNESYIKYYEIFEELNNLGYWVYTLDHRSQGLSSRHIKAKSDGYSYVESFDEVSLFSYLLGFSCPTAIFFLLASYKCLN